MEQYKNEKKIIELFTFGFCILIPKCYFFRDELPPPPKSFEAIGSTPNSLWSDFSEDQEMGMCVSVDPESGYRWSTRYCNGPDKAAFVCQIPGKYGWRTPSQC